jgi:7-cyano-7-deazaguanine synthase
LNLLVNGYQVKAICFDYGQKHNVEIERAKSLHNYLSTKGLVHPSDFHMVKVPLGDLIKSTLMKGGGEVPEGHYQADNMKDTVVPNRNKIFSSIIQAAALSWANEDKKKVMIAMGIHAGDHDIYPDCRQEFRDADYQAFKLGNWDSELVEYYTPYLDLTKFEILQDGLKSCETLMIDFDEVYKRTNTSYKPIYIPRPESTSRVEETHRTIFGDWYSDYKSASSVERVEAFIKLGKKDPVEYADETGPVEWEIVKNHVEQLIKNRNESSNK